MFNFAPEYELIFEHMFDKFSSRFLGTVVFLLLPLSGYSQSSVVAGGGEANQDGVGGLSASVGQVAYSFVGGLRASLSEGVQQPVEGQPLGVVGTDAVLSRLSVRLFPNPTKDACTVTLVGEKEYLPYSLVDGAGKEMERGMLTDQTRLSLEKYSSGTYLLKVFFGKGEADFITLKIIKVS